MTCPDCIPLAARVAELEAQLAEARRPRRNKPGAGRPRARLRRNDERGKLLDTIREHMPGPGGIPLSNAAIAKMIDVDPARLSPSSALSETDMEKLRALAKKAEAHAGNPEKPKRPAKKTAGTR